MKFAELEKSTIKVMEFQSYHYFLTTLLVCFSLDLLMFMFLLVTCNEHHNDENDNEGDGPHL
jgi:hypothetical protein